MTKWLSHLITSYINEFLFEFEIVCIIGVSKNDQEKIFLQFSFFRLELSMANEKLQNELTLLCNSKYTRLWSLSISTTKMILWYLIHFFIPYESNSPIPMPNSIFLQKFTNKMNKITKTVLNNIQYEWNFSWEKFESTFHMFCFILKDRQ